MCVVSMVGDHYREILPRKYDWIPAAPINPITITMPEISRQEFDALKQDVLEMKELLRKAKIYDQQNNQPDCEMEDKIALLRKIADLVGVDLKEVLPELRSIFQ